MRYIVKLKRIQDNRKVYGVWDTRRSVWVPVESFSSSQVIEDVEFLNSLEEESDEV